MTPVVYTNVVLHINVKVLHSLPCPRCACSPPGCECLETGEGRGSTRERASSGASAHTPHVEENILY